MVRKTSKISGVTAKKRGKTSIVPPSAPAAEIGRVIIAPQVLATVARTSALSVAGVAGMSSLAMGSFHRFFRRGDAHQGVRLEVKEGTAIIDLYLVARPNVDLHAMSQAVQKKVTRAMQELAGIKVAAVNVHIEEITPPFAQDKKR